jgi:multiple sugar transport system substrate-binding protein
MPPDVCHSHWTIAMDYAYAGAFIDHMPFLDRDGMKRTDFVLELMDEFEHNGKQYLLPKDSAINACYFNMTLFDKFGVEYPAQDWSIDDFVQVCTLMTRDEGGRPANDPNFDKTKIKLWGCAFLDPTMAADAPAGFPNAYGKHWFAPDMKTSNFDSDAVVQYWEMTRKLRCDINAMPTPGQAVGQGDLWRNAQLVAMTFGHHATTFFAKQEAVQFKYDIAPNPGGPNGQFACAACSGFGVTAKAPHMEEGWRLLKYLTSEEVQQWIGEQKRWGVQRPAIMDAINPTDGIPAHFADVHTAPWKDDYKGSLKKVAMKAPVGMNLLKELYATHLGPVFTCVSDDVVGAAKKMKVESDKVLAAAKW